MRLSIIIVSFNARGDLERCLESLHAAPPAAAHEIIVVDNASVDGSASAARRWPEVHVIEQTSNPVFDVCSMTCTSGHRLAADALPSTEALSTTMISCAAAGGAACNDSRQRSRSPRALKLTMIIERRMLQAPRVC